MNERIIALIAGESGCIAGESVIYDPIAKKHLRIDSIREPFHVTSIANNEPVVGNADVPFRKGFRRLYQVCMVDGQSFVATDHHRVLTVDGYLSIREVAQRNSCVLLPTISDICPSKCPQDASRSFRTRLDFLDRCLTGRHQRDERPQYVSTNGQEIALQRGDAREHIRGYSPTGDRAYESKYIHPYQSACLPSTHDSFHEGYHGHALERQPSEGLCELNENPYQAYRQCLSKIPQTDTIRSSAIPANRFFCPSEYSLKSEFHGEYNGKLTRVKYVKYLRTDWYYDFTVETHHNYLMNGVIHHNTGKSFFVANLRNALIYDTDIGGGLAYADARIKRNESERVQVGSYNEVLADLTRRQKNRSIGSVVTLVIDHLSALHQESCLRNNPKDERDFGRAGEIATREWRRIREFARTQDFNLIVTSHQKPKWENEKAVGLVADAGKNVESDVSIALQIRRSSKYPSIAWVQKWRRDPEDPRGVIPSTFEFTIDAFARLAGIGLLAPRESVEVADADIVARLTSLVQEAKIQDSTVSAWLKKAGVETLADMPKTSVEKCIKFIESSLVKG